MKKINGLSLFFILFLLMIIIGPLIIPLPPLSGIRPVEELMYSDSQFLEIDGIDIHFQERDTDDKTLFVLLHGFGSSTYSWQKIIDPLSEYGSVLAYDRPAFGLTERVIPFEDVPFNPYTADYQPEIVKSFFDEKQPKKIILIGNSAGGTVAIQTALNYPEKIDALVLVSPAVFGGGGAPKWVKPLLNLPQFKRLGPVFVRTIRDRGLDILELAWFDPEKITETDYENYHKPLSIDKWDTALWEFTKVNGDNDLSTKIGDLKMPVLVITGDNDKIIPVEQSIQVAEAIPQAQLQILPNCGHVPQQECPDEFLEVVDSFLQSLE
jgi:pimeloyl-ACP methyl ester carboxylesterase